MSSFSVLLVDGFSESNKFGNKSLDLVRQMIVRCLKQEGILSPNVIVRKINALGDYVFDWEHDILNDKAKGCAKMFDKLDMIFTCGDIGYLPWNPYSMQLVSLFNMANKINKPVFACGVTSLTFIYALATNGTRFHILNLPSGDRLEKLPSFSTYGHSSGGFPGGFFDHETGDIYTYEKSAKSWKPICNVGVHQFLSSSRPSSTRLHAPRRFYSRENRTNSASSSRTSAGSILDGEELCYIRNMHIHHRFLSHLDNQCFQFSPVTGWVANDIGGLPYPSKLNVLGDGILNPVVLTIGNSLLFVGDILEGRTYSSSFKLVSSFISSNVKEMKNELAANRWKTSIYCFVFGKNDEGGTYDTIKDRDWIGYAPPLGSAVVRSVVPNGPTLVDPPLMSMFFPLPMENYIDYDALSRDKMSTTIGKQTNVSVQNPLLARNKRMTGFLERLGYQNTLQLSEYVIEQEIKEDPYRLKSPLPGTSQNLLSGIVMNTKNVGSRKKNVIDPSECLEPLDKIHLVAPHVDTRVAQLCEDDDDLKHPGYSRISLPIHLLREEKHQLIRKSNSPRNIVAIEGHYDPQSGRIESPYVPQEVHSREPEYYRCLPLKTNDIKAKNNKDIDKLNLSHNNQESRQLKEEESKKLPKRPVSAKPTMTAKMCDVPAPPLTHRSETKNVIANTFLPSHRPKIRSMTKANEALQITSDTKLIDTGNNYNYNHGNGHPRASNDSGDEIIRFQYQPSQPFSNYTKFSKLAMENTEDVVAPANIYMTPLERDLHDHMESKKKFLGGDFRLSFGVASNIPLRTEGLVRCCGEFIDKKPPHCPRDATAIDCIVARTDNPDKFLHGNWK